MPQFKVPQNLDMEDRIIGHLTLTQFGYLALGGMLAYFFLYQFPGTVGILLSLPIGIFAFALAVVKVQDQPLPKFVVALIKYVFSPRNRSWQHGAGSDNSLITNNPKREVKKPIPKKKIYTASDIKKIASRVDSHGYSEIEEDADNG